MATSDDGTDDRTEQLEARVAELEEQLDDLKTAGDVATDAQGRTWTVADFMNLGMTRRQALAGISALVTGATLWEGIQHAVGTAAAAGSDQVGTIGGATEGTMDIWAEDFYDENGNNPMSFPGDGSVSIDEVDIGNGHVLSTSRDASSQSLTAKPFSIELFPADGDDRSHFLACNAPDFNNFGFTKWEVDGSETLVTAGQKGTGTAPTSLRYSNYPDGVLFEPDVELSAAVDLTGSVSLPLQNGTATGKTPGIEYQNTSGRTRKVSVKIESNADGAVGGALVGTAKVSGDATSTDNRVDGFNTTLNSGEWQFIKAEVPDGNYYRVNLFGDTADLSVTRWNERDMA